jgi:VanZ family protein
MLRFLKAWLPVVLWAALILSAANDEFSEANTRGWLERILSDAPKIVNTIIRKGGHIVAYAVLALLAWRAHRTLFIALFVAIAVSITDETMQAMTLTREGSQYDVLLDTCGALLATLLVPSVRERLSPRSRPK